MTKGQLEAKVCEAVSRFEVEFMGRGPKKIKALVANELLVIRLQGFLSQAEQRLFETNQGIGSWKKIRALLFESNIESFQTILKEIIPVDIVSVHSDVSTKTGEKMIVVTFAECVEASLGDM